MLETKKSPSQLPYVAFDKNSFEIKPNCCWFLYQKCVLLSYFYWFFCFDSFMKWHHMRTLMWKNFLWMWRNVPVMLFIIGLPVVQTILFCLSIGHDPTGLKVSIVNEELDFPRENICSPVKGCNSSRLSCNYVEYLKKRTLEPVSGR